MSEEINPFADLGFDDFKKLASRPDFSRHEKVGFPDSYREGKEEHIFQDIVSKLTHLSLTRKKILEIGPGCSNLPIMLAETCKKNKSELVFVDSEEMLSLLPDEPHVKKYVGAFPDAIETQLDEITGSLDAILAYSVIQYVFTEGVFWRFVDICLSLLKEGGEILFGDIPNITMRKRFFSSKAGEESHKAYTGSDTKPIVQFNNLDPGQIDDSVALAVLARARAQGFHAWIIPQSPSLPMANRREDILIRKP